MSSRSTAFSSAPLLATMTPSASFAGTAPRRDQTDGIEDSGIAQHHDDDDYAIAMQT